MAAIEVCQLKERIENAEALMKELLRVEFLSNLRVVAPEVIQGAREFLGITKKLDVNGSIV